MDAMTTRLLDPEEPPVFRVEREEGTAPFFFTCDHGGRRLPRRLGDLGLPESELLRHIAWDIGAGAVTSLLAESLDAFAIHQTYSRLVIDCNRDPGVETSIAQVSELTEIPGNRDLSEAARKAREAEIFWPYHGRITAELDRRATEGRPTVFVAMHSFTPVFKGVARPWHVGVLYNRDPRFALALKAGLEGEGDLTVGDNQPYAISDLTDYTIPVHGEHRHLPHVEIEIRQDLITEPAGQRAWAVRLARLLPQALTSLSRA
jgi:predicted N-formylglutamate amidohydrolase